MGDKRLVRAAERATLSAADVKHLMTALKDPDLKERVRLVDEERKRLVEIRLEIEAELAAFREESLKSQLRHETQDLVVSLYRLIKDGLIFAGVWIVFWLVHGLTEMLSMNGAAAAALAGLHEYGLVVGFGIFVLFTLWDGIELRLKRLRQ